MRSTILGYVLVACSPPAAQPAAPPSAPSAGTSSSPPAATALTVPAATGDCEAPSLVPSADPQEIVDVRVIPDATGDGLPDALFKVWGLVPGYAEYRLVASPLRRAISFPDDAAARFFVPASDDSLDVVELDGDGLADFLVPSPAGCGRTRRAVFSPVAGTVPYWNAPSFDGEPIDVDGDGVVEQERFDGYVLDIRASGIAGWAADPFLSIDPGCVWPDDPDAYWNGYESPSFGFAAAEPDLDGDGVRDLWFEGVTIDGEPQPCYGFVFPADTLGTFDPVGAAPHGIRPPTPVGDQTGDGFADLRQDDGTVLEGPFALSNDALVASGSFPIGPGDQLLPIDFDGDGIRDWARSADPVGFEILTGGPAGGVVTGVPLVTVPVLEWEDGGFFVEDGMAVVLVAHEDQTIEAVDIAPAASLPFDP